ncbi:hypothetical protein Taro_055650, partial [Colocasia esculenta]|nr:hypothetical protein [Colocasia esculenta]
PLPLRSQDHHQEGKNYSSINFTPTPHTLIISSSPPSPSTKQNKTHTISSLPRRRFPLPPQPSMAAALPFLLLLTSVALSPCVHGSPPEQVVKCKSGNADCVVTNGYGAFTDRSTCRVAGVAYPTTEDEVLAAVSDAAKKKQHMKVVTTFAHSMPKLSCPGGPDGAGLVISTQKLNGVVAVDREANRMTFQSGIGLRTLIDAAAAEGLALPYTPYWQGISLGGLLATGSHGSSLFGKGSAVHEYVVGMRLVVPTSAPDAGGRYAKVVELAEGDADLLAAKVSLGVLGVVSQEKKNPLSTISVPLAKARYEEGIKQTDRAIS